MENLNSLKAQRGTYSDCITLDATLEEKETMTFKRRGRTYQHGCNVCGKLIKERQERGFECFDESSQAITNLNQGKSTNQL